MIFFCIHNVNIPNNIICITLYYDFNIIIKKLLHSFSYNIQICTPESESGLLTMMQYDKIIQAENKNFTKYADSCHC